MPVLLKPPQRSRQRATKAQKLFLELRRDHALLPHVPAALFEARLISVLPVHSLQLPLPKHVVLSEVAPRIGWLYFLRSKSRTAAIEIGTEAGEHRYPRFHQGAAISALLKRIRDVKTRRAPSVRGTHIRLLRVNALHMSCIWLRGHKNVLIPAQGLSPDFKQGVSYSEHAFITLVAEAASPVLRLHAELASLTRRTRRR